MYAIAAVPIGRPGWPEFAVCTPSADKKRIELIALFLDEYQTSLNLEILQDIEEQLEFLKTQARENKAFYLLGKLQIIESKKALLEGHFKSSLQILEETAEFAKEKALYILEKEVEAEKSLLVEKYDQMETFLKSDANMYEKMKELKINQYLKSAMNSIPSINKKYEGST